MLLLTYLTCENIEKSNSCDTDSSFENLNKNVNVINFSVIEITPVNEESQYETVNDTEKNSSASDIYI